jgi:hypothetical protein
MTNHSTVEGPLLAERYRVGARLRSTPLAHVYDAYDIQLDRPMHLTIERGAPVDNDPSEIAAGAGLDGQWSELLFAAAIQSALHVPVAPGLPLVHDLGETDSSGPTLRWMITEPVPGVSVDRYRRAEPGSDREWEFLVLQVAEQLTAILQRLHTADITHGALGPSTVIIAGHTPADLVVSVVDLGPRPELTREHPTAPKSRSALWRWWGSVIQNPAPEVAAGREPDGRSDVYGFGRTIAALLASMNIPELGWAELLHPTDEIDVGMELRRVTEQATKQRPAERQYSFLVVAEQIAAIRSALHAEQHEPGTGLEQLEAATASELPAEFIAALARVSARTPAQWLTWIPGWASLVTRTGLPMRAAAPQKRQRTRFAAYRAQHTWRILRMAAFVLCLAAVPAAGLVWAATADRPSQTVPAPLSTSTLPGAGSTARNASPTPGTGTGSGVVPPLVGTDQSGAAAALAQAGLHLGTVTQQDGNNPAGLILASSPAAGTTAGAGSPVDVTVASGLQTVPNGLVGHSQQQVSAALQGAGFTVTITTIDTSGYVTGYVLDVSPAPGTTAPVASAIAITVAQYTAPTPTPAPTPSGKPTPSTDP